MSDRILLMAVDGLDWPMLRRLCSQGDLPHFATMIEHGAHGELDVDSAVYGLDLIGPEALLSPLLWTTAATGVYYFSHNVFDFRDFIRNPSQPALVTAADVRSPRIWDILSSRDMSSVVCGYMCTYPTYPIRGVMVSDLLGEIRQPDVVSPPELLTELCRSLGAQDYRELCAQGLASGPMDAAPLTQLPALAGQRDSEERIRAVLAEALPEDPEVAERFLRGSSDAESSRFLAVLFHRLIYPHLRDDRFHRAFLHLLSRYTDSSFATCYYRLIDVVSHGFWTESPMASPSFEERYRGVLDSAYRRMDAYLGEILAAVGPSDVLLVMSDHGFTGEALPEGVSPCDDLDYRRTGTHRGPGVFLATGPGVCKGRIADMSILDVCPTILDRLGLPQSETFDGGAVPGLLHSRAPLDLPRISSFETKLPGGREDISPEDEKRIVDHLTALGYLEA